MMLVMRVFKDRQAPKRLRYGMPVQSLRVTKRRSSQHASGRMSAIWQQQL